MKTCARSQTPLGHRRSTFHQSRCAPIILCLGGLLVGLSRVAAQGESSDGLRQGPEARSSGFVERALSQQQPASQLADLPARKMAHARELLSLLSVDESQLATFTDGEPLGVEDQEVVTRILYNMPRFPLNDLQRWARPTEDLATIVATPGEHRADTFLIRGHTVEIERVEILPEAAERLEFDHYFRVRVALDASSHTAVLCSRRLPLAWMSAQMRGEPVVAHGLFLKVCQTNAGGTEFALATPHIGWLPSRPNAAAGITPDLVHLASLGMDVSLFDDVRQSNRQPITRADRECFYQLLATLGKADAHSVRSLARRTVELAPLLQQPSTQHGRLMIVRGTARRAMKLRVDDEDIRERFGIDHYYQIDVFIPLGKLKVRLGDKTNGPLPTFTNNYPVTVCVLQLPPDLPEGTDIREEVSIPGACFKLWAYHSRFVSSFDDQQPQYSPMFIGVEPEVIRFNTSGNPYLGFAAAGIFVAMLASVWIALWRSSRSDSKFKREVLSRRFEVQPRPSLDDAANEDRGESD